MKVRTILVEAMHELRRSPPLTPHERRDVYLAVEELLRDLAKSPHHRYRAGWFAAAARDVSCAAEEEHFEALQLEADQRSGT